jgi:hypothetical protein
VITEMEQARHAEQRGAVLQALRNDYTSEMTSVVSLSRALFMIGHSVTIDGLQFHLSLLADSGYARIWRARELPTFRPDRDTNVRPDKIVFARLAPKGLQLIDGKIPADPDVSF